MSKNKLTCKSFTIIDDDFKKSLSACVKKPNTTKLLNFKEKELLDICERILDCKPGASYLYSKTIIDELKDIEEFLKITTEIPKNQENSDFLNEIFMYNVTRRNFEYLLTHNKDYNISFARHLEKKCKNIISSMKHKLKNVCDYLKLSTDVVESDYEFLIPCLEVDEEFYEFFFCKEEFITIQEFAKEFNKRVTNNVHIMIDYLKDCKTHLSINETLFIGEISNINCIEDVIDYSSDKYVVLGNRIPLDIGLIVNKIYMIGVSNKTTYNIPRETNVEPLCEYVQIGSDRKLIGYNSMDLSYQVEHTKIENFGNVIYVREINFEELKIYVRFQNEIGFAFLL